MVHRFFRTEWTRLGARRSSAGVSWPLQASLGLVGMGPWQMVGFCRPVRNRAQDGGLRRDPRAVGIETNARRSAGRWSRGPRRSGAAGRCRDGRSVRAASVQGGGAGCPGGAPLKVAWGGLDGSEVYAFGPFAASGCSVHNRGLATLMADSSANCAMRFAISPKVPHGVHARSTKGDPTRERGPDRAASTGFREGCLTAASTCRYVSLPR